MQQVIIKYNPYRLETEIFVNDQNICDDNHYNSFKKFIENKTPLQNWVEPILYENWKGIINELVDEECTESVDIIFYGRKIDFNDLQRACVSQNAKRAMDKKVRITYSINKELSDEKLSQDIDIVMKELLCDRFKMMVEERSENTTLHERYRNLENSYERAKSKEFKVVFAGLYSCGKSTMLNALIRRNILPTSDNTCTAKNCRIKHEKKMKNQVSLECFDINGKTVVEKEIFNSDTECKARFCEIAPIGKSESNPKTVDTIEVCLDLSYLYPSENMEKKFQLVIVDTPGCNSTKTKNIVSEGNHHVQIALDAIHDENKEMVVICADGQDYEEESIGMFLKEIVESADEDGGNFNDRFLFVLNKCDLKKYNKEETVDAAKKEYADYLTNPNKWGISTECHNTSFVPRIFMVCGYPALALIEGVVNLSDEELAEDEEKQNFSQAYRSFHEKIIKFKNHKFYLSEACDIPEYRKNEFTDKFEVALSKDDEASAIEIQTGIVCIESAIKDYIERYAYPIKVRSLIETFDSILNDVAEFANVETQKLRERTANLGKNTSEREEVEEKRVREEEKTKKLSAVKTEVEQQKKAIAKIKFDHGKMNNIRKNLEVKIETSSEIIEVRENNNKYSAEKVASLMESIEQIFDEAWKIASSNFEKMTIEYKSQLSSIIEGLKGIIVNIEKNNNYDLAGYNFLHSVSSDKIIHLDINKIRDEINDTKETIDGYCKMVHNPIKDEQYNWYQFGKKLKQFFAPDKKAQWTEAQELYNVEIINISLTNILTDFRKLCELTEKNYTSDIENIKKQVKQIANDLIADFENTIKDIKSLEDRIEKLGNNMDGLQREMQESEGRLKWLKNLKNIIDGV